MTNERRVTNQNVPGCTAIEHSNNVGMTCTNAANSRGSQQGFECTAGYYPIKNTGLADYCTRVLSNMLSGL